MPLSAFSASEAIDESEVDEGDWRGDSSGETETELGTEESVVGLRLSATRLGTAVDDMVSERTGNWKLLRKNPLATEAKRPLDISSRQVGDNLRGDRPNVGKLASHSPMGQESLEVTQDLEEMTGRPEMGGDKIFRIVPREPLTRRVLREEGMEMKKEEAQRDAGDVHRPANLRGRKDRGRGSCENNGRMRDRGKLEQWTIN